MRLLRRVLVGVALILGSAMLPAFATGSVSFDVTQHPVGTLPASLAVGDFNGDGKSDALVANATSNDVSVLLSDGSGGFTTSPLSPVPVGTSPSSVAVGDVNGDGNPDAVVANATSNDVRVLLGDGSGGFAVGSAVPLLGAPISLALGDINGDGHPDALVVSNNSGSLDVLLGDGSGGFAEAAGSPVLFAGGPISVTLGDVNGDGKRDALVSLYDSNEVAVLLGDGSGGFVAGVGSPVAVGSAPDAVAIGDVNGDGKPDALVANGDSSNVSMLLGDGAGGFAPATGSPVTVGDAPVSVGVGDVNADGKLDAMVANQGSDSMSLLLNTRLVASLSASTLSFGSFGVGTQSLAKSLRVTNGGPAALSISSVRFTGSDTDSFRKVDDDCKGEILDAGESCRILVAFAPLDWGLLNDAFLRIGSNAGNSPQRVALNGRGTPQTTITAGVANGGSTSDTTPTFKFTTDDTHTGRSFQCKVDGAAFTTCTSPKTTAALTRARSHTFYVRAKDPDGAVVDPTPATRTFKVN